MNIRLFLGFLALLPLSATDGFAQQLDNVTNLKLEYWRAFHDLIQQEIRLTNSGEITLNTIVTPIQKPGEPAVAPKHTVKAISQRDLAPILAFFNSGEARQYFALNGPVLQPDGAALSVTVTQNSLSITFASQYAFDPKASRHATDFGKVAVLLFQLAEISIPNEKLY